MSSDCRPAPRAIPTTTPPGETRHDPATRTVHARAAPARRPRAARAAGAQPRLDMGRQIAAVLGEVDPAGLIAASGNPVGDAGRRSPAKLQALAGDPGFRERLARADARLSEHLGAPSWYASLPDAPDAIAYFSPEFGLSEALPSIRAGSASWPATTSRPPATSAYRSSASASSTATATSASC